MFRFIHAADLHLDSPLQGLESHEGAPTALLRGATRRAFENLVRLAVEERVDFVVLCGDVYDGDWKDYSTALFFRRQMVELGEKGIPVYLIAGNHDAASVISKRLPLPGNTHVFSTRTAETMAVASLPVAIHGRGFPNRAVPENLAREYPDPTTGRFNLGLLHTSLTGSGSHDTYAPCTEADLRSKGYDYWALGHIHQPAVLCEDPWIVFAGNCQGRNIRECGPRGCRLVTVNDSLAVESVEWRPLDVLRWALLAVDVSGAGSDTAALSRVQESMGAAVAAAEGRLIAARVVLTGATPLHGSLHRDAQRWRAALIAGAQDLGDESIWIEKVKIDTAPLYDLAALSERDALTKVVLQNLDEAREKLPELPNEISEMLEILPLEIRREIETEWERGQRSGVLSDVRAIILEALGTKGEQAL